MEYYRAYWTLRKMNWRKITTLDPGILAIQIALCDEPGYDSGISQKGACIMYSIPRSFSSANPNPNPNLSLGLERADRSIRGVKERFG